MHHEVKEAQDKEKNRLEMAVGYAESEYQSKTQKRESEYRECSPPEHELLEECEESAGGT